MGFVLRRWRGLVLFIVNNFLKGTRFFGIKRRLLNSCSIYIGKDTKVVGPFKVSNCSDIKIGDNCWIGADFTVLGDGIVVIGDNCDFAPEVALVTGSHKIGEQERRAGEGVLFEIKIGNGCWFGARSSVLGNTIVEDMVVVGTSALVNKNVKANVVVAGVPAKVIKEL